jgi:hypothetical protein
VRCDFCRSTLTVHETLNISLAKKKTHLNFETSFCALYTLYGRRERERTNERERERERKREREREKERERANAQIIYTHHVVYPWVALVRWQLDEAEED